MLWKRDAGSLARNAWENWWRRRWFGFGKIAGRDEAGIGVDRLSERFSKCAGIAAGGGVGGGTRRSTSNSVPGARRAGGPCVDNSPARAGRSDAALAGVRALVV